MTTVYIKLKNLLFFGVVLLFVAFLWFGFVSFDGKNNVANKENISNNSSDVQENKTTSPEAAVPTVTIEPQDQQVNKENFFIEYRLERDRTRSERIEILREIVSNTNSSAQMRQEAQQKLIKISDDIDKESKIENALIAKGFNDAIAVIQPDSVMVIIASNGFRDDEITRISDIIIKVTGCKLENVMIVPKAK